MSLRAHIIRYYWDVYGPKYTKKLFLRMLNRFNNIEKEERGKKSNNSHNTHIQHTHNIQCIVSLRLDFLKAIRFV